MQTASSTDYEQIAQQPSRRALRDAELAEQIGRVHAANMATTMVLDSIEQVIWTRTQEGVPELNDVVHHRDRESQRPSIRFTERLAGAGVQPSVGAAGSSYDALAERIIGLYKTELIYRGKPWKTVENVEVATARWVDWFNNRRLYEHCGDIPTGRA